jgi:hypothetical protein
VPGSSGTHSQDSSRPSTNAAGQIECSPAKSWRLRPAEKTAYRTAAVKPPSAIMEWPVTYEAASGDSHSAASAASCG